MELSSRPIFIVGSPRSGTSILAQMVDAHPSIFCPHWETGLFVHFDTILQGQLSWVLTDNKAAMPLSREDFLAWMRETVKNIFLRIAATTGKSRWAEKTPAHVFHMPLIQELFPECKFVHMIRDGRAVVRSLQQMAWAPRDTLWSVRRWRDSVVAGREYGRSLPANKYIEVRFEALLGHPRDTLQRICDFLEEPFDEGMLEFHRPERNSWRISQKPFQPLPVNVHPELRRVQRAIFRWLAGDLLHELGYR